jgi:tRNA pseudouridine55 synthase
VAGFDITGAIPMDSPELAAALHPISPETFDALALPWIQVDEAAAKNMRQGKPLNRLIGDVPIHAKAPSEAVDFESTASEAAVSESLGVFCDGAFVAVIVKKQSAGLGGNTGDSRRSDRWSYGYVHAGA